jgi:hypothetical protein
VRFAHRRAHPTRERRLEDRCTKRNLALLVVVALTLAACASQKPAAEEAPAAQAAPADAEAPAADSGTSATP